MARRTWAIPAVIVVLALLTTAGGCGPAKLNLEKSFNLSSESGAVGYEAPAQPSGQMIAVDVTSDNPVDVYVVTGLSADDATVASETDLKGKSVASKTGLTQHTLTAAVPAGQKPAVVVRLGAKTAKASGKVKLTN